jgi:peptidyl-tRNA hydrolase
MSPGLQASQAVHVGHLFTVEHPDTFSRWHKASNVIVLVSVPDADALDALRARAISAAIPVSAFTDDDLGTRLTSLVIGPGNKARKLCWGLPKAFSSPKEVAA